MQWGEPWGVGSAWGSIGGDTLAGLVQRAEGEILTLWDAAWNPAGEGLAPESWELAAGEWVAPVVVDVAPVDGDYSQLVLGTDQPLEEGVTYTLTPLATLGGVVPVGGDFVGKQITTTKQPDLDLLDLDQQPFEPYRITPGGDHGMAAGYATFRKLVIGRLLSLRGTIPWAPLHGAALAHKQPRQLDLTGEATKIESLLATVPGMLSVSVQLQWDTSGNRPQLVADIDARGDTGALQETVRL